jgi:hypothetical protein
MRLTRVVATHLLENRKHGLLIPRGNGALEQSDECVFVGVDIRRKPKRCTCIAVNVVGAPVGKRVATEGPDETWEMREVLMRILVQPTRSRVRTKRQDDYVNN